MCFKHISLQFHAPIHFRCNRYFHCKKPQKPPHNVFGLIEQRLKVAQHVAAAALGCAQQNDIHWQSHTHAHLRLQWPPMPLLLLLPQYACHIAAELAEWEKETKRRKYE